MTSHDISRLMEVMFVENRCEDERVSNHRYSLKPTVIAKETKHIFQTFMF